MKNGFTLIELLAVIVILAIIALIATPIILGIINDARKESQERSIELYASAAKNAIAAYQLNNTSAPTSFDQLDIEYDGDVVCTTKELYKDGSIYLADCTVNGDAVDYTYGEKQELPSTQVYKPQYYAYTEFSGTVGSTDAPSNPSSVVPTGKNYYLGYDVDVNNKVSAAYVCFKINNETEYCLKGYDAEAFAINNTVLEDAFKDVENACSFGTGSDCKAGDLDVFADNLGDVSAAVVGSSSCYVLSSGRFECKES